MKQNLRRTISMVLAMVLFLIVPTLAVDTQLQADNEVNYVYLESADQIPWENIPANTAYVVPNDSEPIEIESVNTSVIQPRTHMYPSQGHNVYYENYTVYEQDTTTTGEVTYSSRYFYGQETYTIVVSNQTSVDNGFTIETYRSDEYSKHYSLPANSTLYCFIESNAGFTIATRWIFVTITPVSLRGTIS